MEMFEILIVVAVEIILLMLYGVVRMVRSDRAGQRAQRRRTLAYFAEQERRYLRGEAATRRSALSGGNRRRR